MLRRLEDETRRRLILIATGSEVGIAAEAVNALNGAGRAACGWCRCRRPTVFDKQDAGYRERVLPHGVRARLRSKRA